MKPVRLQRLSSTRYGKAEAVGGLRGMPELGSGRQPNVHQLHFVHDHRAPISRLLLCVITCVTFQLEAACVAEIAGFAEKNHRVILTSPCGHLVIF